MRVAVTYNDATLRIWDLATSKFSWVGLPTSSGKSVTLSATGEALFGDPADLDAKYQVIRWRDRKQLESVAPSEFFAAP